MPDRRKSPVFKLKKNKFSNIIMLEREREREREREYDGPPQFFLIHSYFRAGHLRIRESFAL